mmetsp:Transcript_39860/g.78364  ORF Transcript_39860/g.78364 Transcript_39860/m.78364 type:complete len:240 (-) Transcript_39860:1847-2566(-)
MHRACLVRPAEGRHQGQVSGGFHHGEGTGGAGKSQTEPRAVGQRDVGPAAADAKKTHADDSEGTLSDQQPKTLQQHRHSHFIFYQHRRVLCGRGVAAGSQRKSDGCFSCQILRQETCLGLCQVLSADGRCFSGCAEGGGGGEEADDWPDRNGSSHCFGGDERYGGRPVAVEGLRQQMLSRQAGCVPLVLVRVPVPHIHHSVFQDAYRRTAFAICRYQSTAFCPVDETRAGGAEAGRDGR